MRFGELPNHNGKRCIFARDFMWASFERRRTVETYTRGCQTTSFATTPDILNVLIVSLLEDEQSEERVILHPSGESLERDEWKSHLLLKEPIGIVLTPTAHV